MGAPLLYNLMLSEKVKKEEWVEDYRGRLSGWKDKLVSRKNELSDWYTNIADFWNSTALKDARIPLTTKQFVNRWFDFVFLSPGPDKLTSHHPVRSEIMSREISLKRTRARMKNQRALELWQGDSGTRQLSYRWATASVFISDILEGLKGRKKVD